MVFLKRTMCTGIVNHYGKRMKHLKCIIFLIAYGEMHDLAWKRKASLIKFLRMDFVDLLHYLQSLKVLR